MRQDQKLLNRQSTVAVTKLVQSFVDVFDSDEIFLPSVVGRMIMQNRLRNRGEFPYKNAAPRSCATMRFKQAIIHHICDMP